jgi:hypothetical protein
MSDRLPLKWHSNYAAIQNLLLSQEKLVANGAIYPRWIEGSDRFWYERGTLAAIERRIVDALGGTNRLAFKTGTMAQALETKLDAKIDRCGLVQRRAAEERVESSRLRPLRRGHKSSHQARSRSRDGWPITNSLLILSEATDA